MFDKQRKHILLILFLGLLCSRMSAENLEKTQKKELEGQAKAIIAEAKSLEKSGQLAEARAKYAESQAMIEMKEAAEAIKRLDDEIHKRIKDALNRARTMYEARKYKEAASTLEESAKLGGFEGVLSSNLSLCYYQMGDRNKAVENLDKAITDTPDPKKKSQLKELLTFLATGENGASSTEDEKKRISEFNRLVENVGFEASVEDDEGAEEETSFSDADPPAAQLVSQPQVRASAAPPHGSHSVATHRSSMCIALEQIQANVAGSPAAVYDRANCAQINSRPAEAISLFQKYLEIAPQALDADAVRAHSAELQSLMSVPGENGTEVRRLYALAYGYLAERKYDRALSAFGRAKDLAPEFPLTYWKLGLMYEAMGDIDHARENFTHYQQLVADDAAKNETNLHLTTLDAKKSRYDDEVSDAEDILTDLFNRGMNLSFNLDSNRSAIRARRARVKNKKQQKYSLVGGFAVPYPYAQQQLARAAEHLQVALALFPLGAEANELMGLVFLQANDGRSAVKNFDAVASQGLPVAFYAEMRGHKLDHAVKCELSRERVRFIFLSSYDKKGNPIAPDKTAGDDGLGDITLAPGDKRGEFASLDLSLRGIKKVETHGGLLGIKLAKQEFALSPIYLPSFTPVQGPPARRFANNYTRLFIRYPGLEDSKLGAEGMTGGEKFKMGVNIANDTLNIATNLNPIGSIQATMSAISIARTIHSAMASLSVTFAAWERTVDDQQELLSGPSFKTIPSEPVSLAAFRQ
ncbi:MAG TPA: tetratricopeptide repeat protein [Terriglobales bacterium]|nr:tetratricopeptide repeat protein [Terriglobales bacterium]